MRTRPSLICGEGQVKGTGRKSEGGSKSEGDAEPAQASKNVSCVGRGGLGCHSGLPVRLHTWHQPSDQHSWKVVYSNHKQDIIN